MPDSRPLALSAGLLALVGCGGGARVPPIPRAGKPILCPSRLIPGLPVKPFDAREILGLGEGRAAAAAASRGCSIRVYRRDGHNHGLTRDLRPARIDVEIVRGVVVKIWNVG